MTNLVASVVFIAVCLLTRAAHTLPLEATVASECATEYGGNAIESIFDFVCTVCDSMLGGKYPTLLSSCR
jgi:hypothetical protein